MNTLYLDIFSGISGDMFLGAMIDLGVDFEFLSTELKKLHLDGYRLNSTRQERSSMQGTKFDVHLDCAEKPDSKNHSHDHSHNHDDSHSHDHSHNRNFAQIKDLISASDLSDWVKEKSIAVFQRVAVAEGKVHGLPVENVHFHEVGAMDSIIDIVGACIALEKLGKPRILSGPVIEGTGWVNCAHGRYPLPVAATLEILSARSISVTQCEEPNELVTPTGAALLAEFSESFAPMSGLNVSRIGYGIGTRDNRTRPNVLRTLICETSPLNGQHNDWETDRIAVLESNLDDIQNEWLADFTERVMKAGALDVFLTPILMKKGRPGNLLTILCKESSRETFAQMIFRETTAFGIRYEIRERYKLRRRCEIVKTEFGPVDVKIGLLNGEVVQTAPEYESCRQLADSADIPLKRVYQAAMNAIQNLPEHNKQ